MIMPKQEAGGRNAEKRGEMRERDRRQTVQGRDKENQREREAEKGREKKKQKKRRPNIEQKMLITKQTAS